ncbi:hypothetical protein D9M71_456190 [compost metagenome]
MASARRPLRRCSSSRAAISWPRCATSIRAPRLPPSSMGWLICTLVVRVALRVSSASQESSGLGSTPAWRRSPAAMSTFQPAAASPGLLR